MSVRVALLDPSRGPLGALLGHLGRLLGRLEAILEACWAVLDAAKIKKANMLNMYALLRDFDVCCFWGPSGGLLLELSWGVSEASCAVLRPSGMYWKASGPSRSSLGVS